MQYFTCHTGLIGNRLALGKVISQPPPGRAMDRARRGSAFLCPRSAVRKIPAAAAAAKAKTRRRRSIALPPCSGILCYGRQATGLVAFHSQSTMSREAEVDPVSVRSLLPYLPSKNDENVPLSPCTLAAISALSLASPLAWGHSRAVIRYRQPNVELLTPSTKASRLGILGLLFQLFSWATGATGYDSLMTSLLDLDSKHLCPLPPYHR